MFVETAILYNTMKSSKYSINKIGKQGRINLKANKKLSKLWFDEEIDYCELDIPHECNAWMGLTNAHRHKRDWYKGKPEELLWSYNQVARICLNGHNLIEYNKELTEEVFFKLRGDEQF